MTQQPAHRHRIAYVVSRFPKLSETFILREMEGLEQLGWQISVLPFIRGREVVRHPSVDRWVARLDKPESLLNILVANLTWLWRKPRKLLSLYMLVVRELWQRPDDLARGVVAIAYAAVWARSIQQRGISHVHAHFALHPTVAALAIARLANISFSFTGHSYDIYQRPAMIRTKVRQAAFVVVVSKLLRDHFLAPRLLPGDLTKVRVVRCGVDSHNYERRTEGTPIGLPTILAIARLAEKKGLQYLIEACGILRERNIEVHCRIIGDGPLRKSLQEQINSRWLADSVQLLGARTEVEVRAELERAAIFVLPSIRTSEGDMEGIPVSLMEAMAAGVPVIATRTGAIAELIETGSTGSLVAPGDAVALADAIETIVCTPLLAQQMVPAAQCHVQNEFDLTRNVAMLDQLLKTAIASRTETVHPACPHKCVVPRNT